MRRKPHVRCGGGEKVEITSKPYLFLFGLCGHNRGSSAYFSFVKNLRIGDEITYTTPYGKRVYEVYDKEQIDEYDHSKLAWSSENILTLITCIADSPEQRWAVQCREVE